VSHMNLCLPMARHKVYYKWEGGSFPQVQPVVSHMNLCLLVAKHKVYHKGESGSFPQVWPVVSLVNPCLPVVHPCTKGVLTTH
jgi:hypothetical protein